MPGGGYSSLGLVYEACEALGIVRVGDFLSLPQHEQDLWLGHTRNRVQGAYVRKHGGARARGDAAAHAAALEAIRAQREGRG